MNNSITHLVVGIICKSINVDAYGKVLASEYNVKTITLNTFMIMSLSSIVFMVTIGLQSFFY